MSTRIREHIKFYNCFFVTTTFNSWINILKSDSYYQILTESLNFCSEKYNADIISYVLMPNHIHLILFFNNEAKLPDFMRDFKKFTSAKIRKLLEIDNQFDLVEKLKYVKGNQKFKVWMDRYDAKIILSKNMLLTKINYIHYNPVRNKLVGNPDDWKYSSSKYYNTGILGSVKPELFTNNLHIRG
jgi:putative transposase